MNNPQLVIFLTKSQKTVQIICVIFQKLIIFNVKNCRSNLHGKLEEKSSYFFNQSNRITAWFNACNVHHHVVYHFRNSIGTYDDHICAMYIPSLIMSPFAGVSDRLNRKMLMITADLLIAFVTLIIAVLFFFDIKDIWIIFIITVIRSIGQTIHHPAVSAVYPQIVPKESLVKVQGISQGISSASMVLLPLLAGLLFSIIPIEYVFMIDVVTAVIAVSVLLKFVKLPKHKAEENKEEIKYLDDIKKGLKYVFSHYLVFRIILFGFLFMVLVAAPSFLTYLQVARVFGPETWRLSLLEAFLGTGMLIGSIIITTWGGFKNKFITFFLSIYSHRNRNNGTWNTF